MTARHDGKVPAEGMQPMVIDECIGVHTLPGKIRARGFAPMDKGSFQYSAQPGLIVTVVNIQATDNAASAVSNPREGF